MYRYPLASCGAHLQFRKIVQHIPIRIEPDSVINESCRRDARPPTDQIDIDVYNMLLLR